MAFETEFSVRVGDINYGGHMGNDKFLLLFHDARHRFLARAGVSEQDVGEGVGLIMVDAHIRYKAEVFLGDTLRVQVRPTSLRAVRFAFEYEVLRVSDGKTVASGSTTMAGFDYGQKSLAPFPEDFGQRVLFLEAESPEVC